MLGEDGPFAPQRLRCGTGKLEHKSAGDNDQCPSETEAQDRSGAHGDKAAEEDAWQRAREQGAQQMPVCRAEPPMGARRSRSVDGMSDVGPDNAGHR